MPATVLIVDDHPTFRATARMLLESEGYVVVGEASDGEIALTQTARLHPDVVLLDVNLPGLSGFEVAERIMAANPAQAIILVSSRDPSDFGPLVCRCGARGFISKGELSGSTLAELL
jgi:DNA-binding NarL/FixJ family response regulator